MVLEVINPSWVKKKALYSFSLGVFYSILSFFTAWLLFGNTNFLNIVTLLVLISLTLPSFNKLFTHEERVEATKGGTFWQEHKTVFDFSLYFFFGVFIVLFILYLIFPTLSIQQTQFSEKLIKKGIGPPGTSPNLNFLKSISTNNIKVLLIAFFLSLFYGAGSVFLLVFNAAIFADVLATILRIKQATINAVICNVGVISFHLLPELSSYVIAAFAGGVLSKAIMREKFGSENFKRVLKDSIFLLGIAFVILLIGAIIETFTTTQFINTQLCNQYGIIISTIFLIILTIIIILEFTRHK